MIPAATSLFAVLALALTASAPPLVFAATTSVRTLSLDDAKRELERQSPTLAEARARVEEAAGVSRQALSAALPTVIASGSYVRNSDAVSAPIGSLLARLAPGSPSFPDLLIQPRQAFGAAGTVRVPLFAPVAWADAAAARSAERGAGLSALAVAHELATALVRSAWLAAAAEGVVEAGERALASADEQARLAARALEAGTGVPLSVLQARTEGSKRRSDLVRARAEVDRARLATGVLLGRADPVRVLLPDPEAAAQEADVAGLVAVALDRRPEARAAAAQLEAADRQVTSARLRFLPQISASSSLFVQDVPLPTGKSDGWRVAVELTWPLYDGGFRYGRARQARGAEAGARAAAGRQRLEIEQQVRDAARDVAVATERLALANDQIALAGEAAATARRGFAAGISSSLDVLGANDRLYQAEVGLSEALAALGIARAALGRAVGTN